MGKLDNSYMNRKPAPSSRKDRSSPSRGSDSHTRQGPIITFRLVPEGKLAYVAPPKTYDDGITEARNVFPVELQSVAEHRFKFYVMSTVHHETQPVHIGRTAWHAVISGLPQYDIVNVTVVPEVVVEDTDALPLYAELDAKRAAGSPSQTPSSSHRGSRESSREPSRKSPSPTPKERVREMAINFLDKF